MPPPPDLSAYHLSPAESRHIFNTEIIPADISPIPASPNSEKPLAILAVGQTGAGKTCLVPDILTALNADNRKSVHLIADVYKTYHPAYTTVAAHLASPATGPDARKWLGMAAEEVARRRQDVLIESACRHPSDFTDIASTFHSSNYHVTVVILAVPYALSRLGILVRYYENLPEAQSRGLPLRLTPTKVHDDSFDGLLQASEWLDKSKSADRVLVVRRGSLAAYYWQQKHPATEESLAIADAIKAERKRPLTSFEIELARSGLGALARTDRAAEHLKEASELVQPLLNPGGPGHEMELPSLLKLGFEQDVTDHKGNDTLRINLASY